MNAVQLPLSFDHRPSLGGEDFLVAPCNAEAIAWVDRWPDWPGAALALVGTPGSGKTHIASVFAARSKACFLSADDLLAQPLPDIAAQAPLILEDADRYVQGHEIEHVLFHLLNRLAPARGRLLLTAREAPARWPIVLPDLRSRLVAIPMASIGAPDENLIAGLLVKLFADRQLRVEADVIRFMIPRMERSFESARRLVEQVDKRGMAEGRAITIPLLRELLSREDR